MKPAILFLCVVSIISGCKSTTAPVGVDTTTIDQLYPLSIGNYWMYHTQHFDTSGVQVSDTVTTTEIIEKKTVEGRNGYLIDNGDGQSYQVIYFDSASQLFSIAFEPGFIYPVWPIYSYPMTSGERKFLFGSDSLLHHHDGPYLYTIQYIQFDGSGEKIAIPAGTFSCYHFEQVTIYFSNLNTAGPVTDTSKMDQFLAPGIGLILEKSYTTSTGQLEAPPGKPMHLEYNKELLSYRVY